MRHAILPLLALALLLGSCAEGNSDPARELEHAQALLSAGKFDEAYEEYLEFAEDRDNHLAQFTLGMFHRLGWGRPVNHDLAFGWFERAAQGEIPVAMHYVAEYLIEGAIRKPDPARAAELLRQSAGLGHLLSNVTLAEMYFTGNGVPKDVQQGLALCQDAAKRGAVAAQYRMGKICLEGDLTAVDYPAAISWFEQAAGSGHARARYQLGLMAQAGQGQVPSVQTARYWFETAAETGYAPAYLPTAESYFGDHGENGDPDEKPHPDDLAKAYLWVSAAVRRPVGPGSADGAPDAAVKARAEALRARILEIMPRDWQPNLDAKVDEHLSAVRK